MIIEVTGRHEKIGEAIKSYAHSRAVKIVESFPKVESVHVVVDMQRQLYVAEVVVQQKGMTAVGVKEHANNSRAVIDIAAARAEKQLRKMRRKLTTENIRKAQQASVQTT